MRVTLGFFLGLILLIVQACVVKVPQVESVKRALSELGVGGQEEQESELRWTAKVGAEGRLLNVFKEEELFVFVSDTEDALVFDGWHVRSLTGFGFDGILRVVARGNRLELSDGDKQVSVVCHPWASNVSSDGVTTYTKVCDGVFLPNTIIVDAKGEIIEIDQVVAPTGERVTLRALSGRV